jgi:hypothetical protein
MKFIDESGTTCIIPNESVDRIDYLNTNYFDESKQIFDDTMKITLNNGKIFHCKESTFESQEKFMD